MITKNLQTLGSLSHLLTKFITEYALKESKTFDPAVTCAQLLNKVRQKNTKYLIPQTRARKIDHKLKYPEKRLKYFLPQTLVQKINN